MKKAFEEFQERTATVSLHVRRDQVQVHDDHLTISLPCVPQHIDFASITAQLEDTMPVREARILVDEIGEFLYRKQISKMLADLID